MVAYAVANIAAGGIGMLDCGVTNAELWGRRLVSQVMSFRKHAY